MQEKQNKMSYKPINSLIWQMGLPMIISMTLQAVYNIVDTAFVINMGENGLRSKQCVKWGIVNTLIVCAVLTILFESLASPLAKLFGLAVGENDRQITEVVTTAIRICGAGYMLMGLSIAVQGVLQALGYALYPLLISALRLAAFVFPAVWLFSYTSDPVRCFWWSFPIAELLTAVISVALLCKTALTKINLLNAPSDHTNAICGTSTPSANNT